MSVVVHVIPIPSGMTAYEAFEEIRLLGCLLTENQNDGNGWAVVRVDDDGQWHERQEIELG